MEGFIIKNLKLSSNKVFYSFIILLLILTIVVSFLLLEHMKKILHQPKINDHNNSTFVVAQSPLEDLNISSSFGYRIHPIVNKLEFHPAIDIAAKRKTLIYPILPGIVSKVGKSDIYGNYVEISHFIVGQHHNKSISYISSSNYVNKKKDINKLDSKFTKYTKLISKYCHCDKIFVKQGKTVNVDQPISTVGHTGLTNGDHLHFQVSIDDIWINPLLLISIE